MRLSVIICTHNPREDYLRRTLDALNQQTLPKDQWELLLIDNASSEPLAERWDLSWHSHSRYIREDELGLTPARLRGIRDSKGDLLLFVDDDNVLATDYCEKLLQIADAYPQLGCLGAGRIEPEYETSPLPELEPYLPMLALRTVATNLWSNSPGDDIIPWGAGLAVRRKVAECFIQRVATCPLRSQLGRRGDHLDSGEDDEFSWLACELGLGKGLFPELSLLHLIAARRLEKNYLLGIEEGHSFSHTILDCLHGKPLRAPCNTNTPPDFRRVLSAFLTASPSRFFYEGHRWWNTHDSDPIAVEFAIARNAGIRRALETIRQLDAYNGRLPAIKTILD